MRIFENNMQGFLKGAKMKFTRKQWDRIWKDYERDCKATGFNPDSRHNPNVRKRMKIVEQLVDAELEKPEKAKNV